MTILYRFIDPDREDPNNINARRQLRDQHEYDDLINDPDKLGPILGAHMNGITDDSPIISLTTDFNVAAQTTDTSPGGLGSIVHNAPSIAVFDVPQHLIIQAGWGGLQEGEGEAFVLMPPGQSLSIYLINMVDNIYKGKYWNAENLE